MCSLHQKLLPKCPLWKHLTGSYFTATILLLTVETFRGIVRIPGVNVKQVAAEKSTHVYQSCLDKSGLKKALWYLIMQGLLKLSTHLSFLLKLLPYVLELLKYGLHLSYKLQHQ